jgi:molybdopterin-guanine dinucleotide biosynthesis protein A
MMTQTPSEVSGYILAGGKSSRMGQDKALLELAGKPLVLRAVEKLRRVCAEVSILGSRPELEAYAPLVRDVHEGCGPVGGIEAALLHSTKAWNLFMAVDMPFLPAGFLDGWVRSVTRQQEARVALFTVDDVPQPALCLLHQEVAPFVSDAVTRGRFKLFPLLVEAGKELAARKGLSLDEVFLNLRWNGEMFDEDGAGWAPTKMQRSAQHLWFANLNTPKEFGEAEALVEMLEAD